MSDQAHPDDFTLGDPNLQSKLAEIHREIPVLPPSQRARLGAAAGPASNEPTHRALAEAAASLQESLDSLRLSVKYLVFDLEATKRENMALRLLLAATTEEENG